MQNNKQIIQERQDEYVVRRRNEASWLWTADYVEVLKSKVEWWIMAVGYRAITVVYKYRRWEGRMNDLGRWYVCCKYFVMLPSSPESQWTLTILLSWHCMTLGAIWNWGDIANIAALHHWGASLGTVNNACSRYDGPCRWLSKGAFIISSDCGNGLVMGIVRHSVQGIEVVYGEPCRK